MTAFATNLDQTVAAQSSLLRPAKVTMLRLDERQRAALGETLRELANFAAAALVLGQLVTERASPGLMVLGVTLWVGLVALGVVLAGERKW